MVIDLKTQHSEAEFSNEYKLEYKNRKLGSLVVNTPLGILFFIKAYMAFSLYEHIKVFIS